MKRFLKILLAVSLTLSVSLSAISCGGSDEKTIRVGASPTPHAQILKQFIPLLEEKCYTLEVVEYDDYVLPNTAVSEGDLDANYFQHKPYLDDFNSNNGTYLVSVCAVHYEPFAIYGKDVTKDQFSATKTGRTILIPDDGSNGTRALFLLQEQGYITLKSGVSASDTLTVLDLPTVKATPFRRLPHLKFPLNKRIS